MTFDDLCPKALSCHPVIVRDALKNVNLSDESLTLTPLYLKYWQKAQYGKSVGKIQTTKKLHPDKPSPTIVKAEGNGGLYHFSEPRMLSLHEFQRLAFFPDRYRFTASRRDWKERIGNSVPPGLMRAVAINVKHYLFNGKPLTPYLKSMSYLDILEATWQDHLKPKPDNAPTVISTFAGGGGSSLGYSMSGFRELLAVEIDNNAVDTFKHLLTGILHPLFKPPRIDPKRKIDRAADFHLPFIGFSVSDLVENCAFIAEHQLRRSPVNPVRHFSQTINGFDVQRRVGYVD